MSFLVLLKGGVRKYQTQGFSTGPAVVWGIPVPPIAVFSNSGVGHPTAVFATRIDAERAIVTTEAYLRAQVAAGNTSFIGPKPGIELIVVEVL